jgi:hypothetical protein
MNNTIVGPPPQSVVAVPHLFSPVLRLVVRDVRRELGPGSPQLVPVSYEDRRFSHLLRLKVLFDDVRPPTGLYVKVYKASAAPSEIARMRSRVEHDFLSTRRVFQHMSGSPDLGVIRPIACYPAHLAIVTQESAGETLLGVLEASAAGSPSREQLEHLERIMAKVGGWLRAFQTLAVPPASTAAPDARQYIDVRLQRLVREHQARFSERDRQRVLEHIDTLVAACGPADLRQVPIHADMALANILLDGDRVVVLDFAMAASGATVHDLARLYLQLDLLPVKPRFRTRTIRRLQKSLLAGFDPALDPRHPLFRLFLMRHHVNHFTTLSVREERFPSNVYNWYVRRFHRRWIARELGSAAASVSA